MVIEPTAASEMEAAVAVMGVDEGNPLLEMFGALALAAKLSGEAVETFLSEAESAERVTMRVTDPLDGETHTDVFSLEGLGDAIERVRAGCR